MRQTCWKHIYFQTWLGFFRSMNQSNYRRSQCANRSSNRSTRSSVTTRADVCGQKTNPILAQLSAQNRIYRDHMTGMWIWCLPLRKNCCFEVWFLRDAWMMKNHYCSNHKPTVWFSPSCCSSLAIHTKPGMLSTSATRNLSYRRPQSILNLWFYWKKKQSASTLSQNMAVTLWRSVGFGRLFSFLVMFVHLLQPTSWFCSSSWFCSTIKNESDTRISVGTREGSFLEYREIHFENI